jgi:hypothetical protein
MLHCALRTVTVGGPKTSGKIPKTSVTKEENGTGKVQVRVERCFFYLFCSRSPAEEFSFGGPLVSHVFWTEGSQAMGGKCSEGGKALVEGEAVQSALPVGQE